MRNRKKSAPELYKTRHNIGRRSAAGRVASYSETEVALLFPEGYFRPPTAKVEHSSASKDKEAGTSSSVSQKKIKDSRESETERKVCKSGTPTISKEKDSDKKTTKKEKSPQKKIAEEKKSDDQKKTPDRKSQSEAKTTSPDRKESSAKSSSNKSAKTSDSLKQSKDVCKGPKSPGKTLQKNSSKTAKDSVESPKPSKKSGASNSKNSEGAGTVKKTSKYFGLQPRAPRIKRTACLNAGAIMKAMCRDEPRIKKPKVEAVDVPMECQSSPNVSKDVSTSPNKSSKTSTESTSPTKNTKKVVNQKKKVKVKMKVKLKPKSKAKTKPKKKKVPTATLR